MSVYDFVGNFTQFNIGEPILPPYTSHLMKKVNEAYERLKPAAT